MEPYACISVYDSLLISLLRVRVNHMLGRTVIYDGEARIRACSPMRCGGYSPSNPTTYGQRNLLVLRNIWLLMIYKSLSDIVISNFFPKCTTVKVLQKVSIELVCILRNHKRSTRHYDDNNPSKTQPIFVHVIIRPGICRRLDS